MDYLVVYYFAKGNTNGVGSVDATFRHNPPTMKDIRDMEQEIAQKFSVDRACVVNFLSISEESED